LELKPKPFKTIATLSISRLLVSTTHYLSSKARNAWALFFSMKVQNTRKTPREEHLSVALQLLLSSKWPTGKKLPTFRK
jgi:hypothetical protein